jgi:DNA topoisomerase IB
VIEALDVMRRRRGGSQRLLAYRGAARWADLDASAVNAYISQMVSEDLTAKDFRTWHATVLAAVALAESPEAGDSTASRRRAVKAAVEEVSDYLGNTPTIARASYIDPRVVDQYEDGVTIAATLRRRYRDENQRQAAIEKAVARLIDGA